VNVLLLLLLLLMMMMMMMIRDTRNSIRKTNEIAKFSILDKKTKFTILDEIWMKNGQLIAEKWSNSFTFIGITIMLLQFS